MFLKPALGGKNHTKDLKSSANIALGKLLKYNTTQFFKNNFTREFVCCQSKVNTIHTCL